MDTCVQPTASAAMDDGTRSIAHDKLALLRKLAYAVDSKEASGAKAKGKAKKSSKALKNQWNNIFTQCKLVVAFNPWNVEYPEIRVLYADNFFCEVFGYDESRFGTEIPFSLGNIFGKTTSESTIHEIENSILEFFTASFFINLYRSDGVPLSCHLSTRPLSFAKNAVIPHPRDHICVVTIRSASIVGNSQCNGIGLLGTGSLHKDTTLRTITGDTSS